MVKYFRTRAGRIIRSVFNVLIFLALCAFVLILVSEDFASEVSRITTGGGISADALQKRLGEEISISIVYSAVDGFTENCADKLKTRLSENQSLKISVTADDAFESQDGNLTVYLGHTLQNNETYAEAYTRLGQNGLEITHKENAGGETDTLFIVAFEEDRLLSGIDRFADYFLSVNRLYKTFASLYVTEKSKMAFEMPEKRVISGNSFSLLTISYPAVDRYSLPAIKTLSEQNPADITVFESGLDFAPDRDGLYSGWKSITSSLNLKNGEMSLYLPAADYKSNVQLLSADVLGSLNPEIPVHGEKSEFILLQSEDGTPLGFLLWLSEGSDAENDLEYLSKIKTFAERDVRHKLPVLVFMPSMTKSILKTLENAARDTVPTVFINEDTDTYVSAYAEAVFPRLCEAGASAFIFTAGYTNAGVYTGKDGISLGLTGSLDFNAPGLGGRFEYDNSLRGALFAAFDFSAEAEGKINLRYIYASDYGLTVKNVG